MPLALLKYDGQNTNLNTPHRTAHSVQTQGTQRVADIMFAVDEELTGNFQFVETEQFLGNFFSVGDEIVESTEKKLRDDGLLDQITSFGSSASCEKELYEPFTEVANTILCCTPEELDIGSYWASQPNKAPNNLDDLDDKAVKPRPDAVGALGDHRAFFKAIILLKRGDAEMTDKTEVARLIVDYAASCIRYHGEFKGLSQNELLTQVQEIREKLQQDSNYSPDKILSEAKTLLQNCQLKKSSKQEVKEPNEILTRHTYSTIQKCVKFLHSSTPLQQAHQAVLDAGESRRKTLTPPELSKLNKVASIWWLRVVTPVEIKLKSDKKSKQEGSSQLANYMRMVMRTQPNRHFVFGLLLCGGHLRVLYCDRSGLLATRSWIDIRKEYRSFIRVIISLSSSNHSQLGWDATMTLRLKSLFPQSKYVPSTHPCVQIKDYGISAYDTEWAIQVPDSQGQNGKWYGTVRAVSLSNTEVMVGRATLVWLVKELTPDLCGFKEASPQYFNSPPLILKQGWHRVGGPTEKEFHDKEGNDSTNADDTLHHVGTILSSVQVSALTATFDSKELGASPVDKATFRGGIQGKAAEWERGVVDPEQIGEKRAAVSSVEDPRAFRPNVTRCGSSHFPFAVRVLVRTLMLTYGWPIKYFKDLKELVRTIRDAVQGHRDLYFNRLVLHRDVSAGNILICPNGDDVEDTTGCIIDLDHAKKALKRITYSDPDVVSKSEFNAIRRQLGKILKFGSIEMDQELTGVLIRYFGDDVQIAFKELVKVYVDNLQDSNNPLTDRVWTSTILPNMQAMFKLSHLDALRESKNCPPCWMDGRLSAGPGTKTGTMAFMSSEILSETVQKNPLRPDLVHGEVVHSALHDMESFFWVLLDICLVRDGPGGGRREEFNQPSATSFTPGTLETAQSQLTTVVWCLFDSPDRATISFNKDRLFANPQHLREHILPHLHPYFLPLCDLLNQWWVLLKTHLTLYNYTAQGTIHSHVLDMLNDALDNLKLEESIAPDPRTEIELGRRRRDLESYKLHSFQQVEATESCYDLPTSSPRAQYNVPDQIGSPSAAAIPTSPVSPTPAVKRPRLGSSSFPSLTF